MFKHYLIITLRGIHKDKAFSIINIVGLALAIACAFLLIFWIKFETSFENGYVNKDRIYKLLIEEERNDGLHYSTWLNDISKELKRSFPQIEAATLRPIVNTTMMPEGTTGYAIMGNWLVSNHDYLRMFDLQYLEGSPEAAIQRGYCILTKESAHKFFGNESAIGKEIKVYDTYKVAAIVNLPPNTQLTFDVLTFDIRSYAAGTHYIMLKKGETMTPQLEAQLSTFLSTIKDTKNRIVVQSLKKVHLHSPLDVSKRETHGYRETYGSYIQIIYFSVAVFLILLMAIINYVNTSIARAMNRMKEVGVRKVTGAQKKQLIERFLFESFILTVIAVILSFGFTQFIFPEFSAMLGNKIALIFDLQTILIALGVSVFVSALSGGYAAFYLSSFKPAVILRGGAKPGAKDRLRNTLLGVQFFLSIGILICTVIIYKQINILFNESTGMDRSNIIILDSNLWYESEDFITIIKQENPNIIDATMANAPPYNAPWAYTGVTWEGAKGIIEDIGFTQVFCDSHYAGTFGLEVIQGEFIPPGLGWWQDTEEDKSYNIVVNEAFVRQMGVNNPLGITVNYGLGMKRGKIIGVVKDFNFKPLKEKITPFILSFDPENSMYMYIKTTGKDKQETLDYIISKYKEMKPDWTNRPIIYRTVEDEYNQMYEDEIRTAQMLSVFSIISLFLAIMGVISMVSFMVEKHTKEIAIRKINGAKIPDIIFLFWKDLVSIAAIASVLVIPVCYFLMQRWLEAYIYRTSLSWWIFLGIPLLITAFVCLITAIQVYYTARQRPIESLRSE